MNPIWVFLLSIATTLVIMNAQSAVKPLVKTIKGTVHDVFVGNWKPKKHLPSAHDVFVGNWKPSENDTVSKRVPGFGAIINVFYGDQVCGQGFDNEAMKNIISHYLYYLDFMGVGREEAGPNEVLSCAEQAAFKPSGSQSSS
ncbi:Lysozyme-like domain superfamily [Sesbania bispinosa]|nr:Lysozyme-like domain superfamily [Sesbania bispinosa]